MKKNFKTLKHYFKLINKIQTHKIAKKHQIPL